MKSLVVYSSRTEIPKKVARPCLRPCRNPKRSTRPRRRRTRWNMIFWALGFWVDKGCANKGAAQYMEKVKGKKIGLFGTLGAYPDSDHAKQSMEKAKELVKDNEILGDSCARARWTRPWSR